MPAYDYRCTECKHTFEKRSSIPNRGIPVESPCPECGKMTVVQLIGGAGVAPDGLGYRRQTDDGFKEVLAKIHENTPGSNLGDKLSRTPNRHRI